MRTTDTKPNARRRTLMKILVKVSLAMTSLLAASASSSVRPAACFDGTPDKRMLVQVDEGVRLQVLDWAARTSHGRWCCSPGWATTRTCTISLHSSSLIISTSSGLPVEDILHPACRDLALTK
jgi:hypothetical protein